IGGNLDVHIYDIARIESLSGPQGTLYGASSEAGTIRIIANKPSTAGFEGRVDGEVNSVRKGDIGGKLEGMINAPLSGSAALRVSGFYQRDGGYIDNIAGQRCFLPKPGGICMKNTAFVEKNYNDTESYGARAALKVDLNDSWTATPAVMYQNTKSNGSYGYDAKVGDLKVQHFFPEFRTDKFVQAALTIEGKIGNWDLTYAGAYLDRKTFSSSDYTDYSEAYDSLYSSVGGLAGYFYFSDAAGNTINPTQKVIGSDHFKKLSQELRIASPSDNPLRVVAGLFYQRQSNDIHQDYQVANLAGNVSVNGHPGTLWLTQQHRVDRDYAAFGELTYDLTSTVSLTGGIRAFKYDNDLIGFFGFGRDPTGNYTASPRNPGDFSAGTSFCFVQGGQRLRDVAGSPGITFVPPAIAGTPCTNLGNYNATTGAVDPAAARGSGVTYRFNATWKPASNVMLYGTFSRGFRPGGINRRGDIPAYLPDYLKNYEVGFKTTPMRGVRFNGAIYQQDWDRFQFSFLGPNSFTIISNGPSARVRGAELDLGYNVTNFAFNLNASYTDAIMRQNLCRKFDPANPDFTCTVDPTNSIVATAGTRLPVTPQFKVAGTVRYTVPMGSAKAYGQVNASYQSWAPAALRASDTQILGRLDPYGLVNL
ncbi:MAG: TonB-dependent receptor, partial [Betaproteobacteria bacterium]|nr:TonB-dependent receptor [Betaproteobacteria bacterium]